MNIFGITDQYLELLQMAEDESLDQDMINDTLEDVDWEFEEKADAYAKVMNSLDGTVAAIDKEIERLSQHKKRIFQQHQRHQIQSGTRNAAYRKNKIQDETVQLWHPEEPAGGSD